MRKFLLALMVASAIGCLSSSAFAINDIPEPGSFALLASGLVVGIGYLRARKR